MDAIPCGVDLSELWESVRDVALLQIQDGSGSSHFDGPEGWIHGLSNERLNVDALPPPITQAIANLLNSGGHNLGELQQVLINRLAAGGRLAAHRDGLPDLARFHLPVMTHQNVVWWDELSGHVHMRPGMWYGPVNYCGVLHSVHNPSHVDRFHIVVDFQWRTDARH